MYLINWQILLTQILPPHWRSSWKESFLSVLLRPLEEIYTRFLAFKKSSQTEINLHPQVMTLEFHANRLAGLRQNTIYTRQGGSRCYIYFPSALSMAKREKIEAFFLQYKPAGLRYAFSTFS